MHRNALIVKLLTPQAPQTLAGTGPQLQCQKAAHIPSISIFCLFFYLGFLFAKILFWS